MVTVLSQSPREIREIDRTIGLRIADCRKSLGYSRKTLAEKIGITAQQLHKYEVGINRLPVSRLCDIADALKVQAQVLLPCGEAPVTQAASLSLVRDFQQIEKPQQDAIRQLVSLLARTIS